MMILTWLLLAASCCCWQWGAGGSECEETAQAVSTSVIVMVFDPGCIGHTNMCVAPVLPPITPPWPPMLIAWMAWMAWRGWLPG